MDVNERVTCKHLTDMLALITFKLDSGKHGKALVGNTLLEVVVSIYMPLSRRLFQSRHNNSLLGYTIHQVYQEPVSIMWVIVIELASELVFDIGDVHKVSVGDEIGLTPFLREHVVHDVTEGFGLFTFGFIGVTDEVSYEGLVVRQKLENSLHVAINSITFQNKIAV
jgi:hypothetical protein